MVDAVQTTTPAPTLTSGFNFQAAGEVYRQAGTLDLNGWDFARSVGSYFTGNQITADDVDVDSTVRGSSIDTNLDAVLAGFRGTDREQDMTTFVGMIREHPELKQAAGALLQGEGAAVLSGLSDIVSGNGQMSMDQVAATMRDKPEVRQMFANMLTRVGESEELGMDYAVRFTRDSMAAAQSPADATARNRFMQTARDGGIDTRGVEREAMSGMFNDFFSNPQRGITQFLDSMDLPPEWKEGLTGLLNSVVGFYSQIIGDLANGYDGGPGLIQIGKDIAATARDAGREARDEYLPQTAAPAAPAPAMQ